MFKIGVVGLGYLGEIHIKCLLGLKEAFTIVGIHDLDVSKAKLLADRYNLDLFESLDELIDEVEVLDIVSSTVSHFEIAQKAILADKHVFIEKPITSSLLQAEQLLELSKTRGIKIQVGHVERFNPAFLAIRKKTLQPLFLEAHRLANYNPRGNDVSVVMDLMIHDLDIVLDLVRAKVIRVSASGTSVFQNNLDICNAQVEFENGCVANLSASRVSLKNMRKLRFFQPDSYVSVDFLKKEVQWIDKVSAETPIPDGVLAMDIDLENKDYKLQLVQTEVKDGNAIQMELSDFANSITRGTRETVSIEDAVRALDLAERIERSAMERLANYKNKLNKHK